MTVENANAVTGGLSEPGPMPGYAWGISAWACKTGNKLAEVPNSVCSECYARRNLYRMPNVREANERRLERMFADGLWIDAMVLLIGRTESEYFRWFDTGDIQNLEMLRAIVMVCEKLPQKKFWLPTREYAMIMAYLRQFGRFPANLVVRLSAHLVDGLAPLRYGLPTSTVHSDTVPVASHVCSKYDVEPSSCGDCRACWDPEVINVSYPRH